MKRMVDLSLINLLASIGAAGITAESILNPKMENIIDEDGHKRFQEWQGVADTIEGFTADYFKASISGTHLMIVIAGNLADTTTLTNGANIGHIDIPKWVYDKIFPVWGNYYVERKSVRLLADDWSEQTGDMVLIKTATPNRISISNITPVTLTKDRKFRLQFDLLID